MKNNLPYYFAYGSNLNGADLTRWCEKKGCAYPLGENSPLLIFRTQINAATHEKKGSRSE
jgi:hypothetical protein